MNNIDPISADAYLYRRQPRPNCMNRAGIKQLSLTFVTNCKCGKTCLYLSDTQAVFVVDNRSWRNAINRMDMPADRLPGPCGPAIARVKAMPVARPDKKLAEWLTEGLTACESDQMLVRQACALTDQA
jgi:hypothetical protein